MSYKRTLQKSKEVPMTDYKKLYFALFNTITDAVEALKNSLRQNAKFKH